MALTTLYIKTFPQRVYDTGNNRMANFIRFITTDYITPHFIDYLFEYNATTNSSATPYPLFATDDEAVAFYSASAASTLLAATNTDATVTYYLDTDIEKIDAPVAASIALLVPKTMTVNGHALSAPVVVTASDVGAMAIPTGTTSQYMRGDATLATFPAIPSVTRTTSALSLSLVGSGATGTQIHATKDSTVSTTVSTSTTSTIGGPSTSLVSLKICSTNNATEGSWTTVATFESDQTITLAVALQSIQIVKGQLCADVPGGWYVKLVNSGTGTHSEAFVSGQQTIYG